METTQNRWTNWAGNVSASPARVACPGSEEELVALIAGANQEVRVVGSGHSFQPLCATDDLLLSLDRLQGVIELDPARQQATVWAGTKLYNLGEPLLAAGFAMQNLGDIDRQSLAGAIATGTHGTGPALGNLSSQVVGLGLITAQGEMRELSPHTSPRQFKAAQVSLGALGVISRVTLQLLPAYRLHQRTWPLAFDACMEQLAELTAATRHFEFFWAPPLDVCACKALHPTGAAQPPASTEPPPQGLLARYLSPERIDWSSRILPSQRENRFVEMEFAVPAAQGPACMQALRTLMQTDFPQVAWPVEYRTLAADEIWLSPAYQRETVTISIHQAADQPYARFFAEAEALFRSFQGRPHWGKLHSHTGPALQALYPRWQDFQAVRQALDPDGRFLNPYLAQLFT